MRVRLSPLALFALPHLITAVSLSDFLPRVQGLPSNCDAIYTSTISGCQGSDFTSSSGCSTACVNGLVEMENPIKAACGNQGISGENVVVAYLANKGPSQLCANAQAVLAGESASSIAAAQSTTGSVSPTTTISTSATSASSSDASTSTTSTIQSSTGSTTPFSTVSPTSTQSFDSSSSPTSTSSQSSSSTHSSGASQTGDGSGGGSPFDTQGNVKSAGTTAFASVSGSFSAMCLGLLLLFLQ